jgi:hypothetical protein
MFRLTVALLVILISLPAESGITFMRLGESVVQQRLRLKADSPQQKLGILRKQLESTHITGIKVSEQPVPGQVLPNLVAIIPGKEPGIFIVAAPTGATNSKAETEVQWGTMLLLPMLAESIASVPTRRSIVMIAFPNTKRDMLAGLRSYLQQLDPAKRSEVKAIVLLGQLGRTRTFFWVRQSDSVLADWVQLAAEELSQGRLFGGVSTQWPEQFNSVPPFIQLWSSNEENSTFRGNSFARTKIEFEHYYNAYQLLCVLLLELDQRAGDDLKMPNPAKNDTPR